MITAEFLHYRNLAINSLSIKPGITTVIGPNGSGKTTFLKLCAGIIVPYSGMIMIDNLPPRETEIGWVNEFPDRNILFLNVFDEIASPLRFRFFPCDKIDQEVRTCSEALGITPLLKRSFRDLSGGEKVLVSLAAALVHHPDVLILDEYDSHLDKRSLVKIEQGIRTSGARYVIRSTQQMDTAIHSDHLLFFDSGLITLSGTPEYVFPFLKDTAYYPSLLEC
jgi:energy-coupling factor transport system ATP-binding protein